VQPEAARTGVMDFPLCQVMGDHDEAGFHYARVVTAFGRPYSEAPEL
jgi:hypothetical protein